MRALDAETIWIGKGGHDPDMIWLGNGDYEPDTDEGCLMEWVAFMAGEPWSDAPECVSPVIAEFLRVWQDSLDDENRQDLKRFLPVIDEDGGIVSSGVMGTATTHDDELARLEMITDWLVRVNAPVWLDRAGFAGHAAALRACPPLNANTAEQVLTVISAVDDAVGGTVATDVYDTDIAIVRAVVAVTYAARAVVADDTDTTNFDAANGDAVANFAAAAADAGADDLCRSVHDLVDRMILVGQPVPR